MTENRSTASWRAIRATALVVGLLTLAGLAAGCQGRGAASDGGAVAGGASPAAAPGHLAAAGAKAFLASHANALVLDVRNPDEWNDDLGHIEGAKQVPLPELRGRMGELDAWRDKPVVAVCRVGGRSAQAAEMLTQAGFRQVWNLEGGMAAWRQAGN